jgi:hypothetical protein
MASGQTSTEAEANASNYNSGALQGISVAYNQQIRDPKVRMSRLGRAAARRKNKRVAPVDPTQNNPNDIGAIIVPPGQGIM